MELIIVLIALLVSIVTNLLVVRSLKNFQPREVELFSATLEKMDGCGCVSKTVEEIREILFPPLEESFPVTVPKEVDESYHAWKNRTEEPILAPPSPHKPPPPLGPLERPYGFTR